jgi:hypothetical protein
MSTNHLSRSGNRGPLGFDNLHRFLGEFDPGLIRSGHQGDQRMFAFPRHGAGRLDHGLKGIQQGAMEVDAPKSPNTARSDCI